MRWVWAEGGRAVRASKAICPLHPGAAAACGDDTGMPGDIVDVVAVVWW